MATTAKGAAARKRGAGGHGGTSGAGGGSGLDRRARMKAQNPVDKAWFKARIEARGTSMRRIAAAMGVDVSAVSNMFSGVRRITLKDAEQLAVELGVPFEDVIKHAGVSPPGDVTRMVRVVGAADGDGVIRPLGEVEGKLPRHMARPGGLAEDAQCIVISAPGSRWDRCVAYYVPSAGIAAEAIGRISVIQAQGGTRVIGMISRALTAGHWTVRSLDGLQLIADARVIDAAPVLWLRT